MLQLATDHADKPAVEQHLSKMSTILISLLHIHDQLYNQGLILSSLVVLLACLDRALWLEQLAADVAALEGVLVALSGDFGFNVTPEAEAVEEGQEAAWTVMAALSRHLVSNAPANQV